MLTFQTETIDTVLHEIKQLLPAHCAEAVPDIMTADTVNFDMYAVLEDANVLHIITARNQEKELVGYAIYFVAPDPHRNNELTATSDAFYLLPEYRGWNGVKLMQYAEKSLIMRGIKRMVNSLPVGAGMGNLMCKLGFKAVSLQYMKNIGG